MSLSAAGNIRNKVSSIVGKKVSVIAFPDKCSIQTHTPSQSPSGGMIKGTVTNAYTNVPCSYKPTATNFRGEQGGKTRSVNEYILTLPCVQSDGVTRYNFDIKIHRIVTDTSGVEPAHTFRPISVGNKSGVVFEIICEKEN